MFKAIVSCLCGTPHELAEGESVLCQCGRVVLVEKDARKKNCSRPWVDQNGNENPSAFDAPQIVGWKLGKRGRK